MDFPLLIVSFIIKITLELALPIFWPSLRIRMKRCKTPKGVVCHNVPCNLPPFYLIFLCIIKLIVFLAPDYWNDQIKEDEVGGTLACMRETKNEHRVLVGNSEVRDQLENMSVDGRMILKWIKELRQHVRTDPGSGVLWKLGHAGSLTLL